MKKLNPLVFIPGAAFWALVIAGFVTKIDALLFAAAGLAVVTVVTMLTFKVRAAGAAKAETRRIWRDGTPAMARVIAIGTKGGGINDHPLVDIELEVERDDRAPVRAKVSALISKLAIPRIQPECRIAVRLDPKDAAKLVVDPALTPYGYDG